jgi:hypothetical protein
VLITGYLFGSPPLYGGALIPVAFCTALSCFLLATALLFKGERSAFQLVFGGDSIFSLMMRIALPGSMLAVLAAGQLEQAIMGPAVDPSFFLVPAVVALLSGAVVIVLSFVAAGLVERNAQRARQETETCLQQGLVRSPLDGHCQPPCGAHTCPAWQHCEEATGLCLETKGAAQGALELLDRVANLHGQGPVPGRTLPLEAFLELFWEGSLFAHRADLVGAQLGRLHPARLSRAGLELVALRELEGGLWQADTRAGTRWFLVQDRGQWLLDHFQN